MRIGDAEKHAHGYRRHNTTTSFAALKVATGQVTGAVKPKYRRSEFRSFLRQIGHTYPDTELHLVEIWFGIIDRQAIKRGVFTSVKDLNAKIRAFVTGRNKRKHPFVWTKTTDEILPKTNRQPTSETRHQVVIRPSLQGRHQDNGLRPLRSDLPSLTSIGVVAPLLPAPLHIRQGLPVSGKYRGTRTRRRSHITRPARDKTSIEPPVTATTE